MSRIKTYHNKTAAPIVFSKVGVKKGRVWREFYYDDNDDRYFVKWEDGSWQWRKRKELIFVGDKVRFVNKNIEPERSWCFPSVGTVGTVKICFKDNILVQWPAHTTSGDDAWFCRYSDIEFVEDNKNDELKADEPKKEYTDEEVWEFLKPKMKQHTDKFLLNCYSKEVREMVVAAYRSGYGRASKGRPFKIGDKK